MINSSYFSILDNWKSQVRAVWEYKPHCFHAVVQECRFAVVNHFLEVQDADKQAIHMLSDHRTECLNIGGD